MSTDRRAAIREYLHGRGYERRDSGHAEAWELSGPGGQPSLRVIFWPRVTRVYGGLDWRDEFDVDRPPGPVVAYLEAAERELGLAPVQALGGPQLAAIVTCNCTQVPELYPCEHNLPTVAELRAYMERSGFTWQGSGPAGEMWVNGDVRLGVPHDDSDPDYVRGAVRRVALAEGRSPLQVTADVRSRQAGPGAGPGHVLPGVLRSQVTAAITAHEDDGEWPDGAVAAVMTVIGTALEAHDTARAAVSATGLAAIREQAGRYLAAVYGPEWLHRAPETFEGPERWVWAVANDQGPMAETAIAGIEQACAQRREGSDHG